MEKISIIIPTIKRKEELDKLLFSIQEQHYPNLEVIIVDQNKQEIVKPIIQKYEMVLNIKQYRVNFKGAAKARNYGFKKARGSIINFTDDDAELSTNLLMDIQEIFAHKEMDALFGKVTDRENKRDILYFRKRSTKVKITNVYHTTIETSMFIRREAFEKIGMYDERLGIGTKFGAEEGADLVYRMLYQKYNLQYIAKTFFYHANKREESNYKRAYQYSLGFGGLTYKHISKYKKIYPLLYFGAKVGKDFLCMILGRMMLNKEKARYHYAKMKGKKEGIKQGKEYLKTVEY